MASENPELPNAGKWFGGFIDVTRWIKDGGTLIRLISILLICFLLYTGGKQLLGLFKKPTPLPSITATNTTGGKIMVENVQEKKTEWSLFNLF